MYIAVYISCSPFSLFMRHYTSPCMYTGQQCITVQPTTWLATCVHCRAGMKHRIVSPFKALFLFFVEALSLVLK